MYVNTFYGGIAVTKFLRSRFISQMGIGLLELMLSMAVISVLLVISVRYYSSVKYQEQLTKTATMIREVINAANSWGTSNPNYLAIDIDALINSNLLPGSYKTNPYGGRINVLPVSSFNPYSFTITLSGVPESACAALKSQFPDYSIAC